LILGNRVFGMSSSLRHICAACFPANISFFKYDWRKEAWNLFFAIGIYILAKQFSKKNIQKSIPFLDIDLPPRHN